MLTEQLYALSVNGRFLSSVLMMKGNETEYAYGYLTTEGIVPAHKIESVMVDETDISVLTTDTLQVLPPKKTIVSGCGGTASYLDAENLPKITGTHTIPELTSFRFTSPVLKEGGFSAGILTLDSTPYLADDLGQLLAIDKAIGSALLKQEDLSSAVLLISGKVSADTVRKALYAKIPAIISKYPATSLANKMAHTGNLHLQCNPSL